MPLVMLDTNFALRATLSTGAARKLWVIFAYGAAIYRSENLALDIDELASEQLRQGGVVHAHGPQIAAAQDAVARFVELLPLGTPSNWVLAGSQACWDEYERKARELAKIFGREIDARMAAMLMRRYQSICVTAAKPAYVYDIPQLTSDPDDDLLVFDALRMGVDIFISDDSDVVPDDADGCKEYQHGDKRLQAMRSEYFIDHYCDAIDWDGIDGAAV